MIQTSALDALLVQIAGKVPPALVLPDPAAPWNAPDDHPLGQEFAAARRGEAASLPVAADGKVLWLTMAPQFEALRSIIEDLRAWLMPSHAWEHSPSLVTSAAAGGSLSASILAVSPAGYFRWQCAATKVPLVAERLRLLRRLCDARPPREAGGPPSLGSLRQRFLVALAIGDFDGASAAVDAIDQHHLDTAVNTVAMRIRLYEAFGMDQDIVDYPQLSNLVSVKLPRRIAAAILRAHHRVYLAAYEKAGDPASARDAYQRNVEDVALRLPQAFTSTDDARLAALRSYQDGPAAPPSPAQPAHPSPAPAAPPVDPPPPAAPTRAPAKPILGWPDVPTALREEHDLTGFIARMPTLWTHDAARQSIACADALMEAFTDPDIVGVPARAAAAEDVMLAVIDDRVCDAAFPSRDYLALYVGLLDCWALVRSASAHPADGQFLLSLAQAVLLMESGRDTMVADLVRRWWQVRPIRARLAWLLEALDLLSDYATHPNLPDLWLAGAELIAGESTGLSPGERRLWVRVGRRLGLPVETIDGVLGPAPASDGAQERLRSVGLKKVAIVSLWEKPAQAAAKEIKKRTGADVVIVADQVAGSATDSAATSDVVLVVWSASKHAVYRAFDHVRDRLEYVQGTGAASIVLALERWIAKARG